MAILSLKSMGSIMCDGRLILGTLRDSQAEHRKSYGDWTTSGRNPCCFNSQLKRSGVGCPMFRWAFNTKLCSSLESCRNRGPCWTLWLSHFASSDSGDSTSGWILGFGSASSAGACTGSIGSATDELGWISLIGLQAKTVIPNRTGCPGRTNCLCAKFCQYSQSGSHIMVPLCRWINTIFRNGASSGTIFVGGPMVLSVPLQDIAHRIFFSGISSWSFWMMLSFWISVFPTRLVIFSTSLKITFHWSVSTTLGSFCLVPNLRRLATGTGSGGTRCFSLA